MENEAKIKGSGTIQGGTYTRVSIMGSGEILGDLSAESLSVSGSGSIKGSATLDQAVFRGSGSIEGSFKGNSLSVYGSIHVTEHIKAGNLTTRGSCAAGGIIHATEIDAKGSLDAAGDVETEMFTLDGSIRIGGLLNANRIQLWLRDNESFAAEIGGDEVIVQRRKGLLTLFERKKAYLLSVTSIEATSVYLEHSKVDAVRGSRVHIGPDCHIRYVEYTDSLEVHPSSVVEEQTRLQA